MPAVSAPRLKAQLRACLVCGEVFVPRSWVQQYCQASCRHHARWQRRPESARGRERYGDAHPARQREAQRLVRRAATYGRAGRSSGTWKRLCAIVLAPAVPVCGICGGPIDKSLSRDPRAPHPLSATVDHIIERVTRPDLAEELSNLQPAHRICNLRKGAYLHNLRRRYTSPQRTSERPRVGR